MMAKTLTIAICTYGRDKVLLDTIHSVLKYADPKIAEVVVADQNSRLASPYFEELADLADKGRIVHHRLQTPSLTAARNFVMAHHPSEFILFLDDDVIIHEGFIEAHLESMQRPGVAAATGQVYECRGGEVLEYQLAPIELPTHFSMSEAGFCQDVIGANHIIRRSTVMELGGYDENYTVSARCEDFDLAARLVKAGHQIYYNPEAWLVHRLAPQGGGRIIRFRAKTEWSHSANFALYLFRHAHGLRERMRFVWWALRTGPLRKWVVMRPWFWPAAWACCGYGFWFGFSRRKTVKNSWFNELKMCA